MVYFKLPVSEISEIDDHKSVRFYKILNRIWVRAGWQFDFEILLKLPLAQPLAVHSAEQFHPDEILNPVKNSSPRKLYP